jgi:hypothetical protein
MQNIPETLWKGIITFEKLSLGDSLGEIKDKAIQIKEWDDHAWWYISVIPATWEVEFVESQSKVGLDKVVQDPIWEC